jgi:Mce-associated membrane protein
VTGAHRRLLSYGLSAGIVVALAFAVVLTVFGSGGSTAASTEDSRLRQQVQRVAAAFATNVNTYSSSDIASYTQRVRPMLSDSFERSFSRAIRGVVAQMRTAKIRSRGEVLVTGVSSLDPDSATVLVVCDADVHTAVGSRARHFRWEVDLIRRDGRWLVNGFEPQ